MDQFSLNNFSIAEHIYKSVTTFSSFPIFDINSRCSLRNLLSSFVEDNTLLLESPLANDDHAQNHFPQYRIILFHVKVRKPF